LELDGEDWDYKFTALHFATYFGHASTIQLLAAAGCQVDKSAQFKVQSGWHQVNASMTPLSLALSSPNYKQVVSIATIALRVR
jgi:ankyrin repeat protein